MKFLVLGGGAQGSAAAFDLLKQDDVEKVVIGDLNTDSVHPSIRPYLGGKLELAHVDASSEESAAKAMVGMTGVLCALPYYFNFPMTRLAVEAGAHFSDLGGNTAIVEEQRTLGEAAKAKGISITPDTGLAPGMVNILAQGSIEEMDHVDSVRMWVGGLPQDPKPPLNYQIVYSMEGVLDYYSTPGLVLRDGKQTTVEPLTGMEMLNFDEPLGQLEAFYTGGGISTLPIRYEGTIKTVEYKTLRYPGHAKAMKVIRDLGLISDQEVDYRGTKVNPRDFFIQLVSPKLRNPDGNDLVVARVEVAGTKDGEPKKTRWDVLDYYDPETGITAMMRTTGFTLSITGLMQARNQVTHWGFGTPDEVMPADMYVKELRARGVSLVRSEL